MNTRDNSLRAIRYDDPAEVPLFDGSVWTAVQLGGNFEPGDWTDHWGVVWQETKGSLVPVDVVHPLADLSKLDDFDWPDPQALTWTPADQQQLDAIDRDSGLVGGLHVRLLCERLCCLMGMDKFMLALYDEPERIGVLIDRIVEYNLVVIGRLVDLGIDVLHVSEDLGTQQALMISPDQIRRLFMPAYERMFEEPRRHGVLVDFHSCGHIQEIVPDLVAVGVDILNPLQARANDLREIKQAVAGKTALLGGIDSAVVLSGQPDDIRREVRRAFDVLKPGGGWLAGPDQVIVGAPEENVRTLWDACRELAAY